MACKMQSTRVEFAAEGSALVGTHSATNVEKNGMESYRAAIPRTTVVTVSRLQVPHTTRGDMVAAIEEMLQMIEHGISGSSTGEDGRRTLAILLGILQSHAAGNKRKDFPIADV
jgi:predicted dehydrogenase